nr:tripartite tricarboxylate transporter TctB family protein [Microbacterium proteolyticum]
MAEITPRGEPVSLRGAPKPSPADLVGGGVFLALGAIFAVASLGYELGTPLAMGPGAFPLGIALLLVALGIAVLVKAFVAPSRQETFVEEPATAEQMAEESTFEALAAAKASQAEGVPFVTRPTPVVGDLERGAPLGFGRIPWRPLLIIMATIVFFAVAIDGLGLLLSVFIAVAAVSFARKETTVKQALLTSVALTVLCYLVFSLGLGLNVPVIGPWIGG